MRLGNTFLKSLGKRIPKGWRRSPSYCLDPKVSPSFANIGRHLQARGWRSLSHPERAMVNAETFALDTALCQTLEHKHHLMEYMQRRQIPTCPQSYTIDWQSWSEVLSGMPKEQRQQPWILKPALMNNGQGIHICASVEEVAAFFQSADCLQGPYVLQQYFQCPHLLKGPEFGHKYSLRYFLVISNFAGCALYSNGYANIALKPYERLNLRNYAAHLTNEHLEGERFNVVQRPTKQFPIIQAFFPQVQATCQALIRSLHQDYPKAFQPSNGQRMALFGIDFLVDEEEHVWLLEVNHGPCVPVEEAHPLFQILYEPFWESLVDQFFEQRPHPDFFALSFS